MDDYALLVILLVFVLGVTIGSFINVLIFRARSGATIGGRSKCLSCAKPLKAKMLIPLFSYLWQRGRCAFCGVKISLQYPIVEALLGVLYVAVLLVHDFNPFTATIFDTLFVLLDASIWTILLAITVYDLRHKIIPDSFSLLLAVFALAALALRYYLGILTPPITPLLDSGVLPSWLDIAAGPLLALPFAALWFFSGGRAMGLGDAKLVSGLAWFLGFSSGVTAIIFSFWIAFFPSLFLLLMPHKRFNMKSEIPFAPFLVLATLVVYISGLNVLAWTL